jgi:hypothetical protein
MYFEIVWAVLFTGTFEVLPINLNEEKSSKSLKHYLIWKLEKNMKTKSKIKQLFKTLWIYQPVKFPEIKRLKYFSAATDNKLQTIK